MTGDSCRPELCWGSFSYITNNSIIAWLDCVGAV